LQPALKGARQIGFTFVSMSLSLVAVFIPLLFMSGLIGRLFHEFAVTLSAAILVSGVVSLTLTPMMCSRFLRPEVTHPPPGLFLRACERGFNTMLGGYSAALRWVLRHQRFILVVAVLTLVATVWLYSVVPKGFFPQQDTGLITGITEASQDISFAAMSKLQDKVAGIVLADPAVATLGSFIGGGYGSSTVNNGRFFVTLKPLSERHVNADEVIARLRKKVAQVSGITLFLQSNQDIRVGGRVSKAQYQYALQSGDLAELNEWTPKLLAELRKLPQLKDVTSNQQTSGLQSNAVIDRVAAARLGVTPEAIDNTLYDALGQRQVSTIYKRYKPAPRCPRSRSEVPTRPQCAAAHFCEIDDRRDGAAQQRRDLQDEQRLPLGEPPRPIPCGHDLVQSRTRRLARRGHGVDPKRKASARHTGRHHR
jgi:multidrug efflux pump subunit AcrB